MATAICAPFSTGYSAARKGVSKPVRTWYKREVGRISKEPAGTFNRPSIHLDIKSAPKAPSGTANARLKIP